MVGRRRLPTPAEIAALSRLSNKEMKREFDVDTITVNKWRKETGIPNPWQPKRQEVYLPRETPREPGEPAGEDDWGKLYEAVASHAASQGDTDEDETRHSADWGDKPVGLLLWSDWHLGSRWTDYGRLREDVETVGKFRVAQPGALHLAHLGDPIDGYMTGLGKASGGLYEETETRKDKQEGMFVWLAKQAGEWDYLLYGCHEAWTLTNTGRDPISPIAQQLGAINGGYGIVLDVAVGEQSYRLVLRHRTRRESSLNTTNAHRALDDDYGPGAARADVIALSHLHYSDLQVRPKAGRRVIYVRAGAYKGGDCFARSIGAVNDKYTADCGAPLLIFLPDRHHVLAFHGHDWKIGLDVLANLRNRNGHSAHVRGQK